MGATFLWLRPSRPGRLRSVLPLTAVALAAVLALVSTPARAQTNGVTPIIVIKPWDEDDHWADTVDELLFFESGRLKGSRESTNLWYWDSNGRIKIERTSDKPVFTIGYSALTFDIESDNRQLDGQLNDVGVVGAGTWRDAIEDWDVTLTAGMGTANDGHWSNSDALYAVAALDAAWVLSESSKLHFGLSYWGNRPLWPDIPLPYANYVATVSDDLFFALGLPDTSVRYRPLDRLELEVGYEFPVDVFARTMVEIGWGFHVYAEYMRTQDGFYIDGLEDRRLFHELDRVFAGVRYISKWVDLTLGFGYVLEQQFQSGFDVRDLDTVGELNQRFLFMVKIQGII